MPQVPQLIGASQIILVVKNLPANPGDIRDTSLGWENPLEESMATHSRFLPGESPWTEKSGGLYSIRVTKSQTQLKQLSMYACTAN